MTATPPHDPRSDEALVAAANNCEAAAFEALYHRYRDWVLRVAMRFTGNHEDALDVFQDTFACLLGKFSGFKLTAKLTTFLYPIVKNISLTLHRKSGRYVSGEDLLPELPAPQGAADSKEDLVAALSVLPGAQREVLLIRYVDGMTIAEGLPLQ